MNRIKPNYIGVLIVLIIIVGSVIGIIYIFGEGQQGQAVNQGGSQRQTETSVEEEQARIASALQDFLSHPPSQSDSKLYELYSALNSTTPYVILFWPSSCSSCSSYKMVVWDSVKREFNNATFLEYDIDSAEGFDVASRFNISSITIVFVYKGMVYGISYGEHVPKNYLEYMVKILTIHAKGDGNEAA